MSHTMGSAHGLGLMNSRARRDAAEQRRCLRRGTRVSDGAWPSRSYGCRRIFRREQRDDTSKRLTREARAAGRLSHPNIVTMHDVGSEGDLLYLVMEFLDGETLHERLQRGSLPLDEAAGIAEQLASALEAVHAAGLLHRDIKPGNVMILPVGQIKLMDFGIARQMDETMLTQAGSFVGTPAYMSPEQCRGGGRQRGLGHLGAGRIALPNARRPSALRRRNDSVRYVSGDARRSAGDPRTYGIRPSNYQSSARQRSHTALRIATAARRRAEIGAERRSRGRHDRIGA